MVQQNIQPMTEGQLHVSETVKQFTYFAVFITKLYPLRAGGLHDHIRHKSEFLSELCPLTLKDPQS